MYNARRLTLARVLTSSGLEPEDTTDVADTTVVHIFALARLFIPHKRKSRLVCRLCSTIVTWSGGSGVDVLDQREEYGDGFPTADCVLSVSYISIP